MEMISVIIPVFNQAQYVGRAIKSVLAQTHAKLEILVVDDGSTDESAAAVQGFQDPRLRYTYQQNAGLSAARNTGLRLSRGEYLSFLDADDEFLPGKLEILLNAFQSNPDLGFVAGQAIPVDDLGKPAGRIFDKPIPEAPEDWLLGNPLHVGSVLLRKNWQELVGEFDEQLRSYEDWDMWLRLALKGCPMSWVDAPVSFYRFHQGQMIRDGSRMTEANFAVLDKVFRQDEIPPAWHNRKDLAYSLAHLRAAANEYLRRAPQTASTHLRRAVELDQDLCENDAKLLRERIAGWVELPKAAAPVRFLEFVYANLPGGLCPGVSPGQHLGEALAGIAFRSFRAGEYDRTFTACRAAIRVEPGYILNRGFLAVFIKSGLKRLKFRSDLASLPRK